MKDLKYYFDRAKAITGSDRQTAKRIGIAENRIYMARKSGSMSNEFCARLAEIIDADPLEIIAAAEVTKHPEKASFWGKWIAASVILSVLTISNFAFMSDSYAASLNVHNYTLCAIGLARTGAELARNQRVPSTSPGLSLRGRCANLTPAGNGAQVRSVRDRLHQAPCVVIDAWAESSSLPFNSVVEVMIAALPCSLAPLRYCAIAL